MSMYKEGDYQGRITAWGFSQASTGNPQFYISFAIEAKINPQDREAPQECPQGERTSYRPLTSEDLVSWLLHDMRELGYDGAGLTELDPTSEVAFDLSGKTIRVRCFHDEYEGRMREKWQLVTHQRQSAQRLGLDDVRKLEQTYSGAVKKHHARLEERRTEQNERAGAEQADSPSAVAG